MSEVMSQSVDSEEQEDGFPAAELIAARERQGLTQRDVARELRLSEKYIDSLERAAFEELPSMVFARGYIRSYTKLIKLDADRYLAVFDQFYGHGGTPPVKRTASGIGQQAKVGDPAIKWPVWIVVLILIGATVWWWKTQQGGQQSVESLGMAQSIEVESADGTIVVVEPRPVIELQLSEEKAVEQSESDINNTAADNADSENTVEQGIDPASVEVAVAETPLLNESANNTDDTSADVAEVLAATPTEENEPVQTVQVAEATVASNSTAEAGSIGSLRVTFTDECWVSVEDVTGEVLAMRVKPAGSELNVSGPTPLKVLLGKSSAVKEVFFNGQPVNVDRASRAGVVRLSLPVSE